MEIVPIKPITPISSITEQDSVRTTTGVSGLPFASVLRNAVENLQQVQEVSRQDSYDLAMGTVDSLEEVMINSAMASLALQTTVDVTSRAVSAYKEVMQMQV